MTTMAGSGLTLDELKQLATAPEQALEKLSALLSSLSQSEEVTQWAIEALENCGVPAAHQTSILIAHLKSEDEIVAAWSCKLLARMNTAATSAQAELIKALSRKELLVKEEAARALGEIGSLTPMAREALQAVAETDSPRLKRLALASLGS